MALQVLTDQQKQDVRGSDRFRQFCKWAILDKARYWNQLDGSGVPGNDHIRWAKTRLKATEILGNPYAVEDDLSLPLFFVVQLTQAVHDDSGAFDVDAVIDYMDANDIFDAIADSYFTEKVKSIQF